MKGIVVSVICGILMSFWSPVANLAIDYGLDAATHFCRPHRFVAVNQPAGI